MSDLPSTPGQTGILDSLTLAASLDTLARFVSAFRARRAGIDPSHQEDAPVATARLRSLSTDLYAAAGRIRLHRLLDAAEVRSETGVIRRFEELMLVSKGAEMLRITHQTLLSLYPVVEESVVEEARALHVHWRRGADEGFLGRSAVDRLEAFVGLLRANLDRPTVA